MIPPAARHRFTPRRGFTLTELLVSLAVVSLLTALIAPGLAGARAASRQTVCASNIRQLQIANELYADDHRELYAPAAADFILNLHRWHGSRQNPSQPFAASGGSLTAYFASGSGSGGTGADGLGVRSCPEFAGILRRLEQLNAGFERSAGGYGYNIRYAGVTVSRALEGRCTTLSDRSGSARHRFRSPASTIAFADSAFAARASSDLDLIESSFAEPRFWPDNHAFRADPTIHFRHRGGSPRGHPTAAVAWLDTHVSFEAMRFTWSSGLYAADPGAVSIGWPGEADDNSLFDFD